MPLDSRFSQSDTRKHIVPARWSPIAARAGNVITVAFGGYGTGHGEAGEPRFNPVVFTLGVCATAIVALLMANPPQAF